MSARSDSLLLALELRGPWIGAVACAVVSVVFFSIAAHYEGREDRFEQWFWTRAVARVSLFTFGAFLLKAMGAL